MYVNESACEYMNYTASHKSLDTIRYLSLVVTGDCELINYELGYMKIRFSDVWSLSRHNLKQLCRRFDKIYCHHQELYMDCLLYTSRCV